MDYSSSPSSTSPSPSQPPQMSPPQIEHFMTATSSPVNTNEIEQANTPPNPHATINNVGAYSPESWSTGLCDCLDDIASCCLTCWCPCITFGRIAEVVDRGSPSCGVSGALYMLMCVTGFPCLYSCFYRSKLREQYCLEEESLCTDCCIHCCCEKCALCQEYRELENFGFDMSIGWHGNMERQKREDALVAPVQGGMTRSTLIQDDEFSD